MIPLNDQEVLTDGLTSVRK